MAKQISICRSSSSISNVVGNVTYIVRNFMIGLFPKNFFKSVYIDTAMSQLEMEKEDIFKKDKPLLIIRPRVSLGENSIFQGLPDWMSTNHYMFTELQGNYKPVLADEENKVFVYTAPDRIKINYEIEIVTSTKMQQINTAYFLKGIVLHKSYFYLNNARIETEVPKYYINLIAEHLEYDLKDVNQRIEYGSYLDKYSRSLITEKIKTSSGNPAYFYIYSANILSMFEDYPDIDDGEQNNQISSNFKISENFGIEFWCPINYILETGVQPTSEILNNAENDYKLGLFDTLTVANFTLQFPIPSTYGEMILLKKQGYLTDTGTEKDILDIRPLFTKGLSEVISYNNKYNLDNGEVFHIDLWNDDSKVAEENVNINWSTLVLENIKPLPNTTYHIALYGHNETITRILHRLDEINKTIYTK